MSSLWKCPAGSASTAALLNWWAAKLLQVGREMFWDNLNIFWKKLLVYLVMSSETNFSWSGPKIKVSAKSGPRHQKGWEPLIYRAYFSTYGLVWFNIRNRLDAEKTYWSKYTDITELKKITVEFTWNPSILLCLFDLIQKNVQLLVQVCCLSYFFLKEKVKSECFWWILLILSKKTLFWVRFNSGLIDLNHLI